MISQFFVLSPRGDTIISRDFRGDISRTTAEVFYRKVKFWKGDAPPIFLDDGITYMFLKKNGLYFVCTTRTNPSPAMVMELLTRLTKVFKDYCGILTEESIRKNFILIYELLDETMDFGYAQGTSTELLKAYVFNEPIVVESPKTLSNFRLPELNPRTTPSTAVHKPIATAGDSNKKRKNEIFVDILERISVTFNSNGYVLNSEIDSTIQMKSYLSGNPELKLALNEELVIGRGNTAGYGVVVLDDCNFHECVRLDEFDNLRILNFNPPDGEFALMNYRITGDFRAPFRIFPFIEEVGPYKLELIIKIRADIPEQNYGGNLQVKFPVPKTSGSVSCELSLGVVGQSTEYKSSEKKVTWNIKKFVGGTEHTLRTKIALTQPASAATRKEIGPISLNFEIPMYNVSNLQVRYLRIMERHKSYNPYRWVRYVTQSSSYVCRL